MNGTSAAAIVRRLRSLGSPARARGAAAFFKTGPGEYGAGDKFLGITVPVLRRLAREHEALAERETVKLLASPWHEARALALAILVRQYERGDGRRRAAIYRLYLRHRARVNNWDLVDCSAAYIVGPHLFERDRAVLLRLARSRSVWDRRIAVLATFHFIKEGEYGETLRLARSLLDDPHDLMHKALGWMLREIGKRNRTAEETFLRRYARRMPRTMLRYAIERFPEPLRRRYLRA
ncbi:MAG: DNA alkylation repair protein [Gemmatimonadales bacterium]